MTLRRLWCPRSLAVGAVAVLVGTAIGGTDRRIDALLALVVVVSTVGALLVLRKDHRATADAQVPRGGFLFLLLLSVLLLATANPRTEDISRYDQIVAAGVGITALVVVALLASDRRTRPPVLNLLLAYVVLIGVNSVVAWLFSVDGGSWARRAFVAFSMPLAAMAVWLLPGARQLHRLIVVVLGLCAGVTVYYLILFGAGGSLLQIRTVYKGAFFQTGGTYAAAILATLAFPFLLAPGRWRLVFAALFALGVAGVAGTFARTFWVTTPAAMAVSVGALRGQRLGRRALFGLVAVLMVSILVQGTGQGGQYAELARERLTQRDLSGTFRVEEASGLLQAMATDPTTWMLGAGFGNRFSFHSTDPYAIGGVGVVARNYSHNWYLEVLWSTGLLGLTVIVLFIVSLFTMLLRVLRFPNGDPHGQGRNRLLVAGLLGTFANFVLAAVTNHPIGILLWNLVLGFLVGAACSIAAADRPPAATVSRTEMSRGRLLLLDGLPTRGTARC